MVCRFVGISFGERSKNDRIVGMMRGGEWMKEYKSNVLWFKILKHTFSLVGSANFEGLKLEVFHE